MHSSNITFFCFWNSRAKVTSKPLPHCFGQMYNCCDQWGKLPEQSANKLTENMMSYDEKDYLKVSGTITNHY